MITQKHARSWAGFVTPENDNGQPADNRSPVKTIKQITLDFIAENYFYIVVFLLSQLPFFVGYVIGRQL